MALVLRDVPYHLHKQRVLQSERSLHQHLQTVSCRANADYRKLCDSIYVKCPHVCLVFHSRRKKTQTLADDLSIPLVGGQVDAEGDELGVDSLLTVFKQHLH